MMLFASISFLFLLLHCAPQEVTADSNDKITVAPTATVVPTIDASETTTATTLETTTAKTLETTTATTTETTTATTPETTTATTPETTTATTPETTTATTPETTTATTPETTTATTESPSPTLSPGFNCCDNFITTDPPATPLLPSQFFSIRATCSCDTNNQSYCPQVKVGEEATGFISLKRDIIVETTNTCVVQVTIKPRLWKFYKHSIEVPLTVLALEEQHPLTVRFQKSDNKERCKEDIDCWHSWDQFCDNGECSCYQDVPSFVKIEEKCFPASKYDEMCKYDEQCMSMDDNTICCDYRRRCKCKDGYRIRNDTNPTCISETPTTTTPETPTTATPDTTPVTTESPSPTVSPGLECCDSFITSDPPTTPLLPTEKFVIKASCSCETKNQSYCPQVVVDEEAKEFISLERVPIEEARNICVVQVTIKPWQSKFNKRSIEVPLTVLGLEKQRSLTVRFQKSDNGENCKEDLDCWRSWDQMCDKGRCSCYKDVPSFVKIEEKCFTASKYDESCKYDEQCMSNDNHTICGNDNKRCKCKDGYWIKSGSDLTCITSSTAKEMIANRLMVYVTAVSSVILFYLMM